MRSALRASVLATAAVTAAVAVFVVLTLPPARLTLVSTAPATDVIGGYHIHSNRSDGSGSVDEIAAAAHRAGLAFIILTDHGDGTRAPDAPAYRSGVLCIDGLEVNSTNGHIVALGLDAASPYPLAGPARDVIEDIHRMGGLAIAAHPDSPKADLRFTAQSSAVDGIEWLNADSEWRDESAAVVTTAIRGLLRPSEAIASLFSRPTRTLQRWDGWARTRPVFGLAALDAHARIGWKDDEEPRRRTLLKVPGYETLFRTVAQVARLDHPFMGDPRADAAALLQSLAAGHSFSIVRALAGPATLEFSATAGEQTVRMGERVDPAGDPIDFHIAVPEAPGVRAVLLQNGRQVASGTGRWDHAASGTGVYRVEVSFPGADVPWLTSNPIVIGGALPAGSGGRGGPAGVGDAGASPVSPQRVALTGITWSVERDASSSGSVRDSDGQVLFAFTLGAGTPHGQYAALAAPMRLDVGVRELTFSGQASQPMRLSVQVRLPGGRDGRRWRRSVYLDQTRRPVSLRLEEFEPVDAPTTLRPIAVPLQSLLFVVDTLNTPPGTQATFQLSDLAVLADGPSGSAR